MIRELLCLSSYEIGSATDSALCFLRYTCFEYRSLLTLQKADIYTQGQQAWMLRVTPSFRLLLKIMNSFRLHDISLARKENSLRVNSGVLPRASVAAETAVVNARNVTDYFLS